MYSPPVTTMPATIRSGTTASRGTMSVNRALTTQARAPMATGSSKRPRPKAPARLSSRFRTTR
jgi:hypothetical protein